MFINRWIRNFYESHWGRDFYEKKADNLINSMQNTKKNLKGIIEGFVRDALMKRFKKLSYYAIIAQHGEKIEKIKTELYNQYSEDIDAHIKIVEFLKKYEIPTL